jgi:hypothetical protein
MNWPGQSKNVYSSPAKPRQWEITPAVMAHLDPVFVPHRKLVIPLKDSAYQTVSRRSFV